MLTAVLLLLVWIAVVQAASNIRNERRCAKYDQLNDELRTLNLAGAEDTAAVNAALREAADLIGNTMSVLEFAINNTESFRHMLARHGWQVPEDAAQSTEVPS